MSHNNNNNNNNNASEDLSKSVISDLYRAMGEKAAGEYIKDIKATKSKEEERKVDSLFVSFERKLSKDLIRKVLADQKGDENAALPILVEHMSQKPKPTNNNNSNNKDKEDEKMKFIAILQSKFPLFETSRIQQVVEECKWNLNESAIKLSVIQTEMQINSLQEMFPSFSKGEVADVLKDCNNNFESAVKQFTRLQEMKESAEKEISKKAAEKERQAAEKERQLREKEQRLIQEKQAEEARRQNDEAKRQEERKRTDEQRRRLIEEQERILDEQQQKEEMRRFEERRRLEEHLRLEEEKELRRVQVEQEQASKAAMIEKLQQSAEFERKKLEEDQKLFAAEKKRLQDEQEKLDREKTQQLFLRLDIAEQHLQDPSTRSTTPDSSSPSTTTTVSTSTIPVSSPPAEHPPQPGDESLKVRMKVSPLVVDVGQQIYVEWEIEAGTSTAYDWIGMYVSDPPQQNKSYVTYQYRGISEKKGLMTFIASANGKYEFRYVRNYQHFHKTEVVCVGPVFDVTAVLTHKEQQPTSATPILSQIVVNWNQRSGTQYSSSWVGLYNKTEKNVKNYITWNRTGKETQLSFPAPTQAGEYEIRFFSQSYEQVAISNPIIISEPTKTS